jgi:hypothetical protein
MFRPRAAVSPDERTDLPLSPFQRRRLDGSWVLPFRDHILPLINEHAFAPFFHARHGAPNRSIATVVGILLLKEFHDLSDDQALECFAFDLRWHIALDLDNDKLSCCQKTLHNFRTLLRQQDQARLLFEQLTDRLLDLLGLDTSRQRLDSTHNQSNFASLKRLALFCESIRLFLTRWQRQRPADYANLPEQLRRRYHTDKNNSTRYHGATTEVARRRLPVVARDLFRLVQLSELHKDVADWPEMATLKRVLAEQCDVLAEPQQPQADDDDVALGPVPVCVRQPKQVPASSLQTPHDPDATYGKKGQGYEIQLCETFGNKATDPDKPEIITHVEVTPSCHSDNRVTVPIIENLKARGIQPEQLETDASYTNSTVVKEARALGTDVNGPVMGSKDLPGPNEVTVGDFKIDFEEPSNSRCPAGQPLSKQMVQEPAATQTAQETPAAQTEVTMRRLSLAVLATMCLGCEKAAACPAKEGKGEHKGERVLRVTEDELIAAQRRRYETTEEFKKRQAMRAGAEATNSEMKRAHGLRKLTVRGGERVKVAVYLKTLGCNVKRVAVYLGKLTKRPRNQVRIATATAAAQGPGQTGEGNRLVAGPGS